MFARVRMMYVWICSTCCCIAVSARVYQSVLDSSFILQLRGAVSGFSAHLLLLTALGCSPDRCRWMRTHNTDSLLQDMLYSIATVSFGQVTTVTRLEIAHILSMYHHIFQSQPSLTCSVIVQTQTGNQNTVTWLLWIPWSSWVSSIRSQMTHALGTGPDLDIDKEIKLISSMLKNDLVFFSFFLYSTYHNS